MGDTASETNKAKEEVLPKFGHGMLDQFCFPPGFINLNHDSYGSLPIPVLRATEKLAVQVEQKPDLFIRNTARKMLQEVRARVAQVVNADVDECVIITNATHGINTILFNIDWQPGSRLMKIVSSTYGAVQRTIPMTLDRTTGVELVSIPVTYPITHSDLLERFRSTLVSIPCHAGQKVVAIIHGIASKPGVLLPWEEMVAICKELDVWSVVDGAHLLGQVPVDLNKTQPDFWVSNGHKWLFSKRASAVFYVPKRNQHLIKFTLPSSIGYVSPQDEVPSATGSGRFVTLFEYCRTIDYVPFLSLAPALDYRQSLGEEERITAYCHSLALEGGKKLGEVLGTEVMDNSGELTANMTNVRLPLSPPSKLSTPQLQDLIFRICDQLSEEHGLMVNLYVHDGGWWTRCSAQIWNEIGDFEKAGKRLLELCKQKEEEMKQLASGEVATKPEEV
ncbi:PLP-dependent transferase [Dacryopinax primogenitus]|uniref:PLP-dependent transferase n=1 Tax=Dacryopinax primogenitus (strain DJM 731) TaxID=1858805 RepID=M5FYY0_DACPD|nr:PLP-dependent transferase [Dacryopinax primogenitus]EJU03251.1 PLP-dependent transferase [Dacryopinax primogenitus]